MHIFLFFPGTIKGQKLFRVTDAVEINLINFFVHMLYVLDYKEIVPFLKKLRLRYIHIHTYTYICMYVCMYIIELSLLKCFKNLLADTFPVSS